MNAHDIVLDRRTFLRAAGVAGAAAASMPLLTGGGRVGAQGPAAPAADLQRLVVELEFDPQRIFRHVADEIGYDPYPGAMRGAAGTLRAGAGNSVDKALLLAALLREAGVPHRFVIGSIDEAVAGSLVEAARSLAVADAARRGAAAMLSPGIAEPWSGQGAWQRSVEADTLFVEARQRAEASLDLIVSALSGAGVQVAAPELVLPDAERDQHVWLQISAGPDWRDMDPSVPGAEAGVAYGSAASTVDALPDEVHQLVTFTASAEVAQAGAPVRMDLLSRTLRVADLDGASVTLVHPTAEWLGIAAALSGTQQYSPTLLVGTEVIEGSLISLSSGGGVGGALGDPGSVDGQAIAEWLIVDVAVPGRPVRRAERVIFDRAPADQRAAGTVDVTAIAPIELVDLDEQVRAEYLPLSGFVSLAVTGAPVPWQMFEAEATSEADQLLLQGQIAHAFPYLRDLLRLETMGDRVTPRYVDDEPGVTGFWTVATAPPENGNAFVAATVDILHARPASVPFTDADEAMPAGILAGALNHAAERMLLEGTLSIVPDPPEQLSFVSVGRLFERAAEQGIGILALRTGDALPEAHAANPHLSAALAAGMIVVVPAGPVDMDGTPRLGWWEVDPTSGLARDRMDDGFGAELGEYAIKLHHLASQAMCLVGLGAAIVSVARGAYKDAAGWAAGAAGMCIAGFGGGGH